jgi:hypothetical protein
MDIISQPNDTAGQASSQESTLKTDQSRQTVPVNPPICSLLTVILTTSVTPSAPSTELLESVLDSIRLHSAELLSCRVIVVMDSYDQIASQARLKKGQVTAEQAEDFDLYKENIKRFIINQFCPTEQGAELIKKEDQAEYGSPCVATNIVNLVTSQTQDKRVTFIEPSRRLGFGLAVRSALRMTETPYVWLQQHDWALVADIPVEAILEVMKASESQPSIPVKYVCLSAVRMLSYAVSSDVQGFPVLKELSYTLKRNFIPPSQPEVRIPLTPMFFWHDKPHIASTAHYLATVFPSRLAMLRGDFIEDKIGQKARMQMKEGNWSKWATWLYYPDEGKQLCLRHLQGRTWLGSDAQLKQNAMYRERNLKNIQQSQPTTSSLHNNADGIKY